MSSSLPFRIHNHLRKNRGNPVWDGHYVEASARTKEYPRMQRIALTHADIHMPLSEVLQQRTSSGNINRPISSEDLGSLLYHAVGIRKDGHRTYPSGGALHPIEIYAVVSGIDAIPSGIHHYHSQLHALEYLWEAPVDTTIFIDGASWAEKAPLIFILTGLWGRTFRKYGDFAYLLGTLEAGHIAQNFLLCATALGFPSCPIGGFVDDEIVRQLNIDAEFEQPVYVIAINGVGRD